METAHWVRLIDWGRFIKGSHICERERQRERGEQQRGGGRGGEGEREIDLIYYTDFNTLVYGP